MDKKGKQTKKPAKINKEFKPAGKKRGAKADQITDHDGALGLLDTLQRKTKGKPSVDVRLD